MTIFEKPLSLNKLTIAILFIISNYGYGQVEYYQKLTTLDSIYAQADTSGYLDIINSTEISYFDYWQQYKISKKLYDLGALSLSQEFIKASAKGGLVNNMLYSDNYKKFAKEIKLKYTDDLLHEMIMINYEISMNIRSEDWNTIHMLRKIFEEDQKLRNDIKIKSVKGKPSIKGYGASQMYFGADSIDKEIHEDYMKEYRSFIHKDSINLRPFVDLVLKQKRLPSDAELKGLSPLGILVIHSAKFNFEQEYTQILKNEIFQGRLEPSMYGWYTSLKSEYLGTSDPYRFSNWRDTLEELEPEEKAKINAARKTIGLIRCPATIWDKNIF